MNEDYTPEQVAEIRRKQKSRAVVMAVLLGAFVLLFYAISIAKML